jgi:hypothetical protein
MAVRYRNCKHLGEVPTIKFKSGTEKFGPNPWDIKYSFVRAYPCGEIGGACAPDVPACLKFTPRKGVWTPKPSTQSLDTWISSIEDESEE